MAPSGQRTAPAVQELLAGATLAGDWTLDQAKSTIGLQSRSVWGLAPVKGAFAQVTGHGTVSPAGEVRGTITVAAGSIQTNNANRDRHLRSDDFLAAGTFPHITFTIDRLQPTGQGATVAGQLPPRGHTQPVTAPATASAPPPARHRPHAEAHIPP